MKKQKRNVVTKNLYIKKREERKQKRKKKIKKIKRDILSSERQGIMGILGSIENL